MSGVTRTAQNLGRTKLMGKPYCPYLSPDTSDGDPWMREDANGRFVTRKDYDALAARLAEAERLLREWRTAADIAKDMCFVPVAKATDKFLGTADSAVAAQLGAVPSYTDNVNRSWPAAIPSSDSASEVKDDT